MKDHRFPYKWNLKDANFTKDKGKVFSCFACGGGSTMGYKLAGYDVIGMNEIDKKMAESYITNHKPKYSFIEDIRTFKKHKDLPDKLYQLDILDGSPPCSSFSMSGNREKDWGKEKKFKEGQTKQTLDDLFFDFINLAKKLQPKIVVAENVKGILIGDAIKYVREIYKQFDEAGYYCQHWLLDASKMGVPQRRERVFFICLRKDLAELFLYQKDLFQKQPLLKLEFNENFILFNEIDQLNKIKRLSITGVYAKRIFEESDNNSGRAMSSTSNNTIGHYFRVVQNKVLPTIKATQRHFYHSNYEWLSDIEISLASSYPIDYNFTDNDCNYLCGMSVPPVMIAQIASNIYEQWLSKL